MEPTRDVILPRAAHSKRLAKLAEQSLLRSDRIVSMLTDDEIGLVGLTSTSRTRTLQTARLLSHESRLDPDGIYVVANIPHDRGAKSST
jgi:hypothetical protein